MIAWTFLNFTFRILAFFSHSKLKVPPFSLKVSTGYDQKSGWHLQWCSWNSTHFYVCHTCDIHTKGEVSIAPGWPAFCLFWPHPAPWFRPPPKTCFSHPPSINTLDSITLFQSCCQDIDGITSLCLTVLDSSNGRHGYFQVIMKMSCVVLVLGCCTWILETNIKIATHMTREPMKVVCHIWNLVQHLFLKRPLFKKKQPWNS